jgi:hypothetical protein
MAGNVQTNLSLGIQAVDTVSAVTVFNRNVTGFQLAATLWQASDWFQVPTSGVNIALPATVVYFVYVRNLGVNPVQLNYVSSGGAGGGVLLLPVGSNVGGIFLYALSAETGSFAGLTALSFTATTATTPIEYFVAA